MIFFSGNKYAGCLEIPKIEPSKFTELSLYNLQGNQRGIESAIENTHEYYQSYYYGYSFLIGKNRLINYDKSEKYLKISAKYCFSPTHYSLGYLYYIENKFDEARKWFLSAKELGDNLASHQLAIMYKNEKNSEKMLENLSFAEKNDFTPSITELGVTYYDGFFVKKDLKKAFEYFERAALRNDPLAQNNLGWMYEHGEGAESNREKAEYWYKIAVENDFSLAVENLKRLHGNVVKSNIGFY